MSERVPVLHYAIPGTELEVIDLIRAKARVATDCWEFFLWASAIQYIFRYDVKGEPVNDLGKALVYLGWLSDAVKSKP